MYEAGRIWARLTLAAAAAFMACTAPQAEARRTCLVPGWREQVTPDSLLAFCAPPEFVQVKQGHMWTRARAGTKPQFVGDEWLNIHGLSSSEAFNEVQPWPPSLLRDTSHTPCIDCLDVSAYSVHWDTVASRLVRVEAARVTGGFVRVHNRPMLQATWLADSTHWVFVQGQAPTSTALNQLRAILRTIQLRR